MISRFQRGSGAFRCEACGRMTRDTGVQSIGIRLCPDDFELAGIYNAYQDGESMDAYADAIRGYTAHIVAKGGKLDGDAEELLRLID